MQGMVSWPGPNDVYSDSGEGGLFAWLVVPEKLSSGETYGADDCSNNCYVDVSAYLSRPRLMLNRPDVCVSPERVSIFESYDHKSSWFEQSMKIGKVLDGSAREDIHSLRGALARTLGGDDVSVPMLAAVFLGSTSHSLWAMQTGENFQVRFAHLTQQGKQVYETLRLVYGVDPLILTFLDT